MKLDLDFKRVLNFKNNSFTLDFKLNIDCQVLAIMGASGSGKSMFLKCLAGLEPVDQGYIKLNDKVLVQDAYALKVQERNLALVPQSFCLYPHLNITQNIAFNLKKGLFNPKKTYSDKNLQRLLDLLDINALAHLYPKHLSSGQQQRVAIARALMTNPSLLLLDEPFSALDTHLKISLRLKLKELLLSYAISCIIVTHDIDDALALANKIVIIDKGCILEVRDNERF